MSDFDQTVDASGLNCPLPILRAKKALNGMEQGQRLQLIATDKGSEQDFAAFTKQTGNPLISSEQDGEKFIFVIEKG